VSDRFAEKMSQPDVRADTRLLGDFTGIYCRGKHREAARSMLASEGVDAGVYGRRVPVVCDECAELLRYAERRRTMCPKDPKPFCSDCDTHCYKPGMRDSMREVMRYSGPRAMFRGYAIQGIRHLIQSRRARKASGSHPGTHNG
jgi:hypothetical protein